VIAHWDDVEGRALERGPMRLTRVDLGDAIGSDRIGVALLKVQPGGRSSPVHCELAEEEIFVILEGAGIVRLGDEEHPARAGHAISRRPGTDIPHSFVATDGPFTHLAYGTREPNDIAYYPDRGEVWLRGVGVTLSVPHDDTL
jgi:uncharacterized cupin superfamily protein